MVNQALQIQRFIAKIPAATLQAAVMYSCAGIALILGAALLGSSLSSLIRTQALTQELPLHLVALEKRPAPAVAIRGEKVDYTPIHTRALMQLAAAPIKAAPDAAPKKTDLPLTLIGTFVEDKKAPYAIIEEQKRNSQEVFAVGDKIFGDATLKAIFIDRVEIIRNGQREVLILDEKLAPAASTDDSGGESKNQRFTVAEVDLDKALENIPLLLTQARAVPYFKDGKAIGLRMFAIRKDSMFEKIGLKNGDILKTVNGNSLGDITQAMKLFERLKEERNLSLNLERNGEEREFSYDIR